MEKRSIKFILFDLGGVVIQDFSGTNKWNEMLSDLGLNKTKIENFEKVFQKYVDALCMGILEPRKLITKIEEETGMCFPKNYDIIQDFVIRFEANRNLEIVLKELKKNTKFDCLQICIHECLERLKNNESYLI